MIRTPNKSARPTSAPQPLRTGVEKCARGPLTDLKNAADQGSASRDLTVLQQMADARANGLPTPPPTNGDAPVQGKFGFEIETRVMATAKKRPSNRVPNPPYGAPDRRIKKMPILGKGTGFALHLDHVGTFKSAVPGGPIIELVTDPPFDESKESEDDVAAKMQRMADTATALAAGADTPKPLGSVANVTSTSAKSGFHLFAGAPGVSGQSASGYVQETMGIKLGAVPQYMQHLARAEMSNSAADETRFTQSATLSGEVFDSLRARLKAAEEDGTSYFLPSGYRKTRDPATRARRYEHKDTGEVSADQPTRHERIDYETQEVMGLLALIANYILAGKNNTPGRTQSNRLLKNLIGQIFFKTSLATVRNKLRGYSRKAVRNAGHRAFMKGELLTKTGTGAGDLLIQAYATRPAGARGPTVGGYIDAVLTGSSDWVYDNAVNPYSKELVDKVGETGRQTPAVVIENRRVKPIGGDDRAAFGAGVGGLLAAIRARGGEASKLQAPDNWADLARQYHQIATALNAPAPQAPGAYVPPPADEGED